MTKKRKEDPNLISTNDNKKSTLVLPRLQATHDKKQKKR